jgi:hypothetical protein
LSLFKDFMKEQYVISSIDIMQLNYFKEDLWNQLKIHVLNMKS